MPAISSDQSALNADKQRPQMPAQARNSFAMRIGPAGFDARQWASITGSSHSPSLLMRFQPLTGHALGLGDLVGGHVLGDC